MQAIVQVMHEVGITDVTTDEIRERFLGVSMHIICEEVAGRSGRTYPPDFVDRVDARLVDIYREELQLIDGVIEMLRALKKEGIAMAIATGASVQRMNDTLIVGGLAAWFEGVAFSADLASLRWRAQSPEP